MWVFRKLQSDGSDSWVTIYAKALKTLSERSFDRGRKAAYCDSCCNRLHMDYFISPVFGSRLYIFLTSDASGIVE
jgi:hypothetical protein